MLGFSKIQTIQAQYTTLAALAGVPTQPVAARVHGDCADHLH